jgi:transposase
VLNRCQDGKAAQELIKGAKRLLQGNGENLAKRIEDILSLCRWHLNTSILEGLNNKIKAAAVPDFPVALTR